MAAISFPSIGILTTSGFSEKPQANVVRTNVEQGFAKQARRSSVSVVERSVRYVFTETEYATFKTFFYTTAAHGSLFFNWTDPVDGVTKDARIRDATFSMTPLTARFNHYSVSMTFETYE